MSDIKEDAKVSVKVFTQKAVSSIVKESTKKLIKSLTESQRNIFEARIKNISDDQLGQYFANNPYFKNALENTIKSVNDIPPEKVPGSWMEKLQSVYEATYSKDLTKVLIWPAPRVILSTIVGIALLVMAAFSLPDNIIIPVANFSNNVTSGSAPLSAQFSDFSENATEWKWDLGDRTNSTEQNPEHTYSEAGNYTVNLTASSTYNTGSKPEAITVLKRPVPETLPPVANFSSNVTSGSAPLTVQFTDLSKNAAERSWDFEDDGIIDSTDENVIHVYAVPGTYTVKLTTTNEAGKDSRLATITVLPAIYTVPVAANFEINVTSGYVPLNVQFKDLSENATEWNWVFGDGTNSTEQNPMHTYYTAGNYTVNLTAINTNGTDSKLAVITVLEQPLIHFYAYVTNRDSNTVSVINTTANNVTVTVSVGIAPWGVAVSQDGKMVYVANNGSSSVSVIDTTTNNVTASVTVGSNPHRIAVTPDGKKAYVTNWGSDNVSVIDTAINSVTASVTAGDEPVGVAVNPEGTRVYVANARSETVSVIDTSTNTITATVPVGIAPGGVAVNPEGTSVYVTDWGSNTVSVINTITNNVTATVHVGSAPEEVIVTQDGKKVYVANFGSNTLSVIDAATNNVTATVPVGDSPYGLAVSPDGTKVYVTNRHSNNVSIIDTATNTITATVPVGSNPHGVAVEQRWIW